MSKTSPDSAKPRMILLSWLALAVAVYVYWSSHGTPALHGRPLPWPVLVALAAVGLLLRLPAASFVLGSLALTEPVLVSPRLFYKAWRHLGSVEPEDPVVFKVVLLIWAAAVTLESFASPGAGSSRYGSSRWATEAEIRSATRLLDQAPSSIPLCYYRTAFGRRRLAEPNPWPILVSAPTGAGKTAGTFIPALLDWEDSAIIIDVKGELFEKTSRAQQERGTRIIRIDPDGPIHGFNPLESIPLGPTRVQDVRLLANVLTNPRGVRASHETSRHFRINAAKLLGGAILLELAQSRRPTLVGVADRLGRDLEDGFQDWLESSEPYVMAVARDFLPNVGQREFLSIQSTALTALEIFREPLLARLTSRSSFRFEELRCNRTFIYVTATPARLSDVSSFVRALLTLAIKALTRDETRRLDVLLVIDEFPILRRFDFLVEALGYLRSYGVRALLAIQGDAQLTEIYGANETVTLHARTRLNYPASDLRSSKSLAEYLGKTTIGTESTSQNRGRYASRSLSRGETGRDLMMADEVRAADPRQCWILTPGCRPIRGEPSYWFCDKELRRLVALGPAELRPDTKLDESADTDDSWIIRPPDLD